MRINNIAGSLLGIVFGLIATLTLKPTSFFALAIFSFWTSAPFIGTLILTLQQHKNQFGLCIAIYLSLAMNILLFVDIRYWHPDPQGAIAFLGLPIISVIIIAVTLAVTDKKISDRSDMTDRKDTRQIF